MGTHEAMLSHAYKQVASRSEFVWVRLNRGAGSIGALPVRTYEQAKNWIDYWADMKGQWHTNFMFCEHLPGREFAWQSLWHDGELIRGFPRERLEYVFGHLMPSGQSSTPSVAVLSKDLRVPTLGAAAVGAVDVKPHGIYGVDMKEDVEGNLKVTEINVGRFYTTSDFGATMGENLPHQYMLLGMGGKVSDLVFYVDVIGREETPYWIRGLDREPVLWTKNNA